MTFNARYLAALACVSMLVIPQHLRAVDPNGDCCPECGCAEGGKFVEVVQTRCKMVPEKKPIKKIVYETKRVPYCEHALTHGHGHSNVCPQCESCARFKTVLVKKEIKCGEKTEMKCVPEEFKVLVPVACPSCGHRCKHHHFSAADNAPALDIPEVYVADRKVPETTLTTASDIRVR